MAARLGTILLTLLVSVPVSAVGLVAAVGLPKLQELSEQFTTATGEKDSRATAPWEEVLADDGFGHSAPGWDDAPSFGETESPSISSAPIASSGPASSQPASTTGANPFASMVAQSGESMAPPSQPATNLTETSSVQNSQTGQFPAHGSSALANAPVPVNWGDQPSSSMPQSSMSQTAPPSGAMANGPATPFGQPSQQNSGMLTWRQASLKLAEIGIDQYHLEPGSAQDSFLFVCLFSPADTPHVTHRFEAEAGEPLQAVNQTLAQVDRWMRDRYAAQNFPTNDSHLSFQQTSQVRRINGHQQDQQ